MAFHRPIPEKKRQDGYQEGLGRLVEAEKLMQIAFLLPSAVLVGWLGGAWLGMIFHQKWIMLAGILFGCIAGLVVVIRQAVEAEKKSRKEDLAAEAAKKKDSQTGDE